MRIVFAGTGTFAEPSFEALLAAFPDEVVGLLTQPDRDPGRRSGSSRQVGKGMAAIASEANVPVIMPPSINTPEGLSELTALNPDLLVVAAYGQILKPDVIATPTLGAINVHASLLPKYRGAAPVAHAILNGETETGVTIIRISPGLDSGDMLAQESLPILPAETAGELEFRLGPLGARLCVDVVRQMKLGPVTGTKQDSALVTKAPKLTKEMGLIDWNQSADRVINQIRAMQPWPTAYTFLHRDGKEPMRIIVTQTDDRFGSQIGECDLPGQLYTYTDGTEWYLAVEAGNRTAVRILELQPAGKKKMTTAEFLRGTPINDGSRVGPERLS
ncbi:methionyl-tRNA formyltransferase [soil metagenome]